MREGRFCRWSRFCSKVIVLLTMLFAGTVEARFTGGEAEKNAAGPLPVSLDPQRAPKVKTLPRYREGEVLVRYKKGVSRAKAAARMASESLTVSRSYAKLSEMKGQQMFAVKGAGKTTAELLTHFRNNPDVELVSPNYLRRLASTTPNDPRFGEMWGLRNTGQTLPNGTSGTPGADIKATQAWDRTTGSAGVVIATIDTGITPGHLDLQANLWHNPGEIPGNGIDDDANGYVDDVYGINAINGSSDVTDLNGHGTHIAGIIAASGNNGTGITGVSWQSKIMTLKFTDSSGSGSDADAIECIDYILEMKSRGVNVVAINASWSESSYNQFLSDAIQAAGDAGIVVVAAAGPFYPASFNLPNIISVAASDLNDQVASFSNFGAGSVDLFAPGVDILSTAPGTDTSDPDVETYFSDDMESGPAQWVHSGVSDTWAISSESAHGGLNAWSDSPGGYYPNNQNSTLQLAQPVNLSGASSPVLSFWVSRNLDANWDFLKVDISADNGVTWQNMLSLTGQVVTWEQQSFAIPPAYRTSDFKLRFVLTSDDSAVYDGVHIDDVRIVSAAENNYAYSSGTSMAAAHVTGALALAAALYPDEGVQQRVDRILLTVDKLPQFSGKVASGGRLNLDKALVPLIPIGPHVTRIDGLYGPNLLVTLQGDSFGEAAGSIVLTGPFNQQNAQLVSWSDSSVTFVLPEEFTPTSMTVMTAAGAERIFALQLKWTTTPGLSVDVREKGVVAHNGMIYTFGGYSIGPDGHSPVATDAADVYDPATNTWTPLAPLSTPQSGLGAAVLNDKIYLVSSYSFDNMTNEAVSKLAEYDPQTNSYAPKKSLGYGRSSMGVAALNDCLYVSGGYEYYNSVDVSSLDRYDPTTDSWSTLAPMSTSRIWHGMVALNGKLWVFGGYDMYYPIDSGEVYDPATNTWAPIAPMPFPLLGMGATTDGRYIYAVGGSSDGILNNVLRYDPIANKWVEGPFSLNTSITGNKAVYAGTSLYFVGGPIESLRLDFHPPIGGISINGGAAITTSTNVTLTLTADGTGSMVTQRRLSTDGGVTWATGWEPYSDTEMFTLPGGSGEKLVSVQFQDAAGNQSAIYNATITLNLSQDTTPPTGTVVINGGASFANSTAVTLTMTADDGDGVGVTQRRISTDGGITWAIDWESYTTSREVTLPNGDGAKNVSVQLRDGVGNISTVFSDSIILDATSPTGTITINGGAANTTSTTVTLTMTADDGSGSGVIQRRVSKDGGTTWATDWEPYTTTRVITLPSGDGVKNISVQLRDGAGNISTIFSAIMLDTTVPIGTVTINGDAVATNLFNVTLTMSADDGGGSGVTQRRISTDGGTTWAIDWEPYTTSRDVTLPSGGGTKNVSVQLRDGAGNISTIFSDSIILDTVVPIGTVTINGGAVATNLVNVTLIMTADDGGGSGGIQRRVSKDGGTTWATDWEPYTTIRVITLPSGDGVKNVSVQLRDGAGNISMIFSDTIILDTVAPTGTISINNGEAETSNTNAILYFTATDGTGSGVTQLRISADNVTWGAWEPYAASRGTVLNYPSAADGVKTRYVQFKDAADNISATYSDTIIFTNPPTGMVSINGGAAYVTSTKVTLALVAPKGLTFVRLSNDAVKWGKWLAVTPQVSWNLSSGDGLKTVTAQFAASSNATVVETYTASVTLDTKSPAGTVNVNGGNKFTNSAEVEITVMLKAPDAADTLDGICVSESSGACGQFTSYSSPLTYILSNGDGKKTIYVTLKDKAGNLSKPLKANIILDTIAPTGSVLINGAKATTVTPLVSLKLKADKASEMQISVDNGSTWSGWMKFAGSKKVTLPPGAGEKTVRVKFRDPAGNVSPVYSDTITLQTTVGSGSEQASVLLPEQSRGSKDNGVTAQLLPL